MAAVADLQEFVEPARERIEAIVQRTLRGKVFDTVQVKEWVNEINDSAVELLQQMSTGYKFVVTCFISQAKGGGLHSFSCMSADAALDGTFTVVWGSPSLCCIVTAGAMAL